MRLIEGNLVLNSVSSNIFKQSINEALVIFYSLFVWFYHNRNRDGMTNQKKRNFVKIEFGVATIVIIGNYGKP